MAMPPGYQQRPPRRPPPPLDAAALEALALAYAGRFATSAGRLADYLTRKLRQRGSGEDEDEDEDALGPAAIEALVERMVALGYVDDAGFAQARAGGLLRRGYGARRIGQALHAAGIDAEVRERVMPDEAAAREAALRMAKKRGFGPFGAGPVEIAARQKQIAAMLRAGHPASAATALVRAASVAAAEDWAAGDA